MKRNYFNNLAGNSFAANAGSKINKSSSARGINKDVIPRYTPPGVADIIGQILGREYDPYIARNRVPSWMNMPENRQNTGMTANARPNTPAARGGQEATRFRSIRELSERLRKQAGGTASRIGAMTPPYNPHAGIPAAENDFGNSQLPGASGQQQQNTPRFTSFRELGEHLKRQARGDNSAAADAGAGIAASGGQSQFERTNSAAANRGSFRPSAMKDPETIRQLAERLRREAAKEYNQRNAYIPAENNSSYETPNSDNNNGYADEYAVQDFRAEIGSKDYRRPFGGNIEMHGYAPCAGAFQNNLISMRVAHEPGNTQWVSASGNKSSSEKTLSLSGADKNKTPQSTHDSSPVPLENQACSTSTPCTQDELWKMLPEEKQDKISHGHTYELLRQLSEYTKDTSKKRGGAPLVIDMTKKPDKKRFDFGYLPIGDADSITLYYDTKAKKTVFKLDTNKGSVERRIGKRETIRVNDGASFEKAAGGGKPLVNCKGVLIKINGFYYEVSAIDYFKKEFKYKVKVKVKDKDKEVEIEKPYPFPSIANLLLLGELQ